MGFMQTNLESQKFDKIVIQMLEKRIPKTIFSFKACIPWSGQNFAFAPVLPKMH